MKFNLFRNFVFSNTIIQTRGVRQLLSKAFEPPDFYKPRFDLDITKEDEPNTELLLSARVRPQVLRFFNLKIFN